MMLQKEKIADWKKFGNWRFAAGVLGAVVFIFLISLVKDYYPYMNLPKVTEKELDALHLEKYSNVMFVAHPDDELLWGGRHLLEDDYLVVCLTRGNDKVRRAEFEAVLSASGDKGLILSYPDKIGRRRSDWKLWRKNIEADIAAVLKYKNWELVVSHNEDGEYGHQHHIMTHESVEKEFKQTGSQADLYWFGEYYVNDKIPYDLKEMDKTVYNKKRELAALYESQRSTMRKLYHMLPYENWILAE
ncbi:PIG-L family deacetylase [Lachnospiraceae bacterium 45-W7]